MKKYFLLLFAICFIIPCLSGCNMTKQQISEYHAFDYNVIWEKADRVVRPKKYLGSREYYSIEGVSEKDFIACKIHHQEIGDYTEEPIVLMHQDKGGVYSLDISSAQLTLRDVWWHEKDQEYWLNLGDNSRSQVFFAIEENVAEEVAIDITATNRQYLSKEQLNEYKQGSPDYLCYRSHQNRLWIEFRLEGYENLIWAGEIMKIGEDYVIAIHKSGGGPSYNYLRCNDTFAAFLKQVEEEYELFTIN